MMENTKPEEDDMVRRKYSWGGLCEEATFKLKLERHKGAGHEKNGKCLGESISSHHKQQVPKAQNEI